MSLADGTANLQMIIKNNIGGYDIEYKLKIV